MACWRPVSAAYQSCGAVLVVRQERSFASLPFSSLILRGAVAGQWIIALQWISLVSSMDPPTVSAPTNPAAFPITHFFRFSSVPSEGQPLFQLQAHYTLITS